MTKKFTITTALLFLSIIMLSQSLSLNKQQFAKGEEIIVKFTALSSYATNAWIGIIPTEVAHGSEAECDKYELSYQYLSGKTSGELKFKAPEKEGMFDIRMFDNDNNGNEVKSISFSVGTSATFSTGNAALYLEKLTYAPGDKISVSYQAPPFTSASAWIGMFKSEYKHGSEVENDKVEISYQYIKTNKSGTLIFDAPSTPGNYDFRMHNTDDNGVEVSNISFTVK
jgi:hypothetical protein